MTLEQKRASLAFGHVQAIAEKYPSKDAPERQQYGTLAAKLPALIQAAGLCQAVHFVRSRRPKKENQPDLPTLLLSHLADQLQRVDRKIKNADSLCEQIREAPTAAYLWLSREAVASATWYARLAKSELGVDVTAEADRGTPQ